MRSCISSRAAGRLREGVALVDLVGAADERAVNDATVDLTLAVEVEAASDVLRSFFLVTFLARV